MNKNVVIAVVLGALVLIAGIQAFQLFTIKDSLASGKVGTSVSTQSSGDAGGSPKLPSNLENLPSMVGGC
jgi:hypothetical protein